MTKPKVVFHPFSEEFFNNPFDIYQRMRDDAPLCKPVTVRNVAGWLNVPVKVLR